MDPKWRDLLDLNPGLEAHVRLNAGDILTQQLDYAIEINAMCNGAPSCCRVHSWRPLASYAFIKMKLASRHLLLYVVYMCQKSLNFIDAFGCCKQKWKLAKFNLGPPCSIHQGCFCLGLFYWLVCLSAGLVTDEFSWNFGWGRPCDKI